MDCTAPDELAPSDGTGWVAGLDPAFRTDDFGLAIVGRDRELRRRLVVGAVRAWKPRRAGSQGDRRAVEDELLAAVIAECERFGVRHAVTDQHASHLVVERLAAAGIHARVNAMSGTTNTAAFVELRSALYSGDLALPADPELPRELRALRRRITPGAAAVEWPRARGSHGDRAQALALAVGEHVRHGAPASDIRRGAGRGGTMTGGLLTREL